MADLQLVHGDCTDLLDQIPVHGADKRVIFMDPPDNIGLKYNGYKDNKPDEDYYRWLELLILKSLRVCSIFWVSYYWKHDLEIKHIVRNVLKFRHPSWQARPFLWNFTFSQYEDKDCAVGFRLLLRLTAPNAKLNVDAIRETSTRQLIGDARAAGPRVPDNIWNYSRVVGNAQERRSWHPTQHPEALYQRIMDLCVPESGMFVDLFAGSGTCFRASRLRNHRCVGCEIDDTYVNELMTEHHLIPKNPDTVRW